MLIVFMKAEIWTLSIVVGGKFLQHSFWAHFWLPLSGPQLPAKTPETMERRAMVEKRIMN
jgi:hypothetical protein